MNFDLVKNNLERLGYKVECFDTKEEAADYLAGEVRGKTVGIGGTMTVKQMGLYEKLSKNNEVAWHLLASSPEEAAVLRRKERESEVYFSSVNGLSEQGEIINIDGGGNRVADTTFGHEKVYFVVGENKIAPDYEQALWRARNIAAPKNAQRLGKKTPCAVKGDRCYNCKSPDRICRILSVFWEKPIQADVEIVLIHENLGY